MLPFSTSWRGPIWRSPALRGLFLHEKLIGARINCTRGHYLTIRSRERYAERYASMHRRWRNYEDAGALTRSSIEKKKGKEGEGNSNVRGKIWETYPLVYVISALRDHWLNCCVRSPKESVLFNHYLLFSHFLKDWDFNIVSFILFLLFAIKLSLRLSRDCNIRKTSAAWRQII